MVIKLSEKESFHKSFLLFFLVIEILLAFIFYQYYRTEEEHLQENILLEMKNYSLSFDNEAFDIDIIPFDNTRTVYTLYQDTSSYYILVPFPDNHDDLLKIYYPLSAYKETLSVIRWKLVWQFFLLSLVSGVISFGFSLYILTPLRDALSMMEDFIKDMIHDINTPLSAILINLKMMDTNNSEVQNIQQSAKTMAMLQQNLDAYLKESPITHTTFSLSSVIQEQVDFFAPLYDYLNWTVTLPPLELNSDPQAFSRILYNLLSNACKYNTHEGYIQIMLEKNILIIRNNSYGIKHPEYIFDRFYKESERGLGIGLHIVAKLCEQLSIKKHISIAEDTVTFSLDLSEVTSR